MGLLTLEPFPLPALPSAVLGPSEAVAILGMLSVGGEVSGKTSPSSGTSPSLDPKKELGVGG